jgi:hypothetical protein
VTAVGRIFHVTFRGHQWSSDGACLVRDDQPLPELDELTEEGSDRGMVGWMWLGPEAFDPKLLPMMESWAESATDADPTAVVHSRFRPMLGAADHVDQVAIPEWPKSRVVRVWRGGEVVAFIAPIVRMECLGEDDVVVDVGRYLGARS